MRKQFIYFTGVLFLMTAFVLAATAQENTSSLNNTTTMNNTTLNVSINQTQNATSMEHINVTSNETMIAAPQASLNETANGTLNPTETNETNETVPVEVEIAENETVPAMNETNETVPVEIEIVPAENETVPAMNETNETVPAQNVTIPVQNETAAAQNIAIPENVTLKAEPANSAGAIATGSQPMIPLLGSSAAPNVIVIGGGLKTPRLVELGKVRLMMWAPN